MHHDRGYQPLLFPIGDLGPPEEPPPLLVAVGADGDDDDRYREEWDSIMGDFARMLTRAYLRHLASQRA